MPPLSHRRARVLAGRGSWFGAAVALLALVIVVLVHHGTGESARGGSALAPDVEDEASGSALDTPGVALDFEVSAPNAAATTGTLEAGGPRRARVAARAQPEAAIVIGFEVTDEINGRPLNAWRASLGFELARGDERWTGRRLQRGQRYHDAILAFGQGRKDSLTGADEFVYVELEPATPRGVPLAFTVELIYEAESELGFELLPRATFHGAGTLTLSGAPYQQLPDVAFRRVDAWATGMVVAGPHIALDDARVELIETVVGAARALGGEVLAESSQRVGEAAASATVLADRTFTVPAPSRPTLPRMRLCLVLADGRTFPTQRIYESFKSGIVLHVEATRTATGRLLFRGAPATGLAHLHAEQGGARVGQVSVERDGTFTLSEVPYGAVEVVLESGRPGGELARLPLASLVGNATATTLALGVIEVAGHAEVMELELVDRNGAPAAALLRWRGRGGSGGVSLRAAAVHTLLLAPIVPFDMELVAASQTEPIALAATAGRVRIVVGE